MHDFLFSLDSKDLSYWYYYFTFLDPDSQKNFCRSEKTNYKHIPPPPTQLAPSVPCRGWVFKWSTTISWKNLPMMLAATMRRLCICFIWAPRVIVKLSYEIKPCYRYPIRQATSIEQCCGAGYFCWSRLKEPAPENIF